MINNVLKYLAATLIFASVYSAPAFAGAAADGREHLDLSGDWAFSLDENKVGVQQHWFEKELPGKIKLPGTIDQQQLGIKTETPEKTRLTREYRYVGPAWYQKTVTVPAAWKGKRVELFLERSMWETQVWVDNHYIGTADSLVAPNRFELTEFITPGAHRITMRIDNRLKINVGHNMALEGAGWARMWAMSLTEESQGNWNGAIGKMELRATDPVWIKRADVYTNLAKKEAEVTAYVWSRAGQVSGELTVFASCGEHKLGPVTANFKTKSDDDICEADPLSPILGDLSGTFYESRALIPVKITLPFGEGAKLWDEFDPNMYDLKVELKAVSAENQGYRDSYTDRFGLREFKAEGKEFKLNGRTVYLRANQDNCIHPKTAYPPMDKEYWIKFLQLHKDYGLNSMRFHSWCPPKAAFDAADELGMFVHTETPVWDGHGNVGYPADRANFVRDEAERILDAYGNHPSFCMMAIGNELGLGKELYLQYLVEVLSFKDSRHLYTPTCHPLETNRNDEFFVTANGINGLARSFSSPMYLGFDYESAIGMLERPIVAHEIGQHTSFPDYYSWFDEKKYTGNLKAHYIPRLRGIFEQNHPPERGPKFAKASGALQLLLYKTELEAQFRSPSNDGFHLNGILDYPGEGVALIGMLDVMGDSKGIVAPKEFRRFCSETVALTRIKDLNLIAGTTFEADAMVRHHGPEDAKNTRWFWSLSASNGTIIGKGDLGTHTIKTGGLTDLGKIIANLPNTEKSQEMTLNLWAENSDVENSWQLWLYPDESEPEEPKNILMTEVWDEYTKEALASGKSVFFTPSKSSIREPVDAHFWTIGWGRGLFPSTPRPMGIYCDPSEPALADFPNRGHSQWHWFSLLSGSTAIDLSMLPKEFAPTVFMIDDFNESHRLAMLMEVKVGKGRLLVSSLNLGVTGQRALPQQQMLRSLYNRVSSPAFNPAQSLTLEQLDNVFRGPEPTTWQKANPSPKPGEALFVEKFEQLTSLQPAGTQPGTGAKLIYLTKPIGWTEAGLNATHAVERSGSEWAIMVLGTGDGKGDNILTMNRGIRANEKGKKYRFYFDAGPTVYAESQRTQEGDMFLIQLLRPDESILQTHKVSSAPWRGAAAFTEESFEYTGDGSGNLRIRIQPVPNTELEVSPLPRGAARFLGAISNIRVMEKLQASK